jgi:p70 ribosomal S6 kinase
MVSSDGHVKMIDFGLCKDSFYDASKKGTYCGTKEYMAPEVANRLSYGPPADWWSFGALSYDIICNAYPYLPMEYHKPIE